MRNRRDSERNGGEKMTLQQFQKSGGCEECYFYANVEVETERKECTFPWFDSEAEEWGYLKNCDKMEE